MDEEMKRQYIQENLYIRQLARTRGLSCEEKFVLLGLRDLLRAAPEGSVSLHRDMTRKSDWLDFVEHRYKDREATLDHFFKNLKEAGYIQRDDNRKRGLRSWTGTIDIALDRPVDKRTLVACSDGVLCPECGEGLLRFLTHSRTAVCMKCNRYRHPY